MAEVLGIVAGAAQLLDLSTRVLVASSSLYGKLKNIPDEIETLKKNTELFIDLLWMISSDFDGPINSQVHSLHVTHRVTSILHDARKESEELALLLEGLSSNSSSAVRRKWSAVVGATKEKDIAESGSTLMRILLLPSMALLGTVDADPDATARFVLVILLTLVLTYPSMDSNSSAPRRPSTRRIVLNEMARLRGHAACVPSAQESR
ncbi:hypothetical protein Neosp_006890 [[Neocosmospora] mangrovei]